MPEINRKDLSGPEREAFELSDGRQATIVAKVKPRHLLRARRLLSEEDRNDPVATGFAMACILCEVEGRALTLEELVDEWDLVVANELVQKAMSGSKKNS